MGSWKLEAPREDLKTLLWQQIEPAKEATAGGRCLRWAFYLLETGQTFTIVCLVSIAVISVDSAFPALCPHMLLPFTFIRLVTCKLFQSAHALFNHCLCSTHCVR